MRTLTVCCRQNLPFHTFRKDDRLVPDPVNWTMQRAQKHELQKSLARMVFEQGCVADIAEEHFNLLLPRYLLHLWQ